jgi:hypothetical protein
MTNRSFRFILYYFTTCFKGFKNNMYSTLSSYTSHFTKYLTVDEASRHTLYEMLFLDQGNWVHEEILEKYPWKGVKILQK